MDAILGFLDEPDSETRAAFVWDDAVNAVEPAGGPVDDVGCHLGLLRVVVVITTPAFVARKTEVRVGLLSWITSS
jgi:hypothetical protein